MDFLGRADTFVRIVRTGSLSAAAREQRLSLAAVSRQVASLEAELGATLLLRTTRRIQLTDEGRRFHEHAARLVHEAVAARASVRADDAASGPVVLSASVTLGVLVVLPRVAAILERHPRLDLEVRLEDRAAELVGEGVDIAVRAGMTLPDTTALVAHPLATYARHVVASPSYLRRHGTPKTLDALAGHRAVLGLGASGRFDFTVGGGATQAVTFVPRLRVGSLLGVRAAALEGLGVAVLPDFVVASAVAAGELRVLVPSAALAPVTAHALHRSELRGTPRIDAVVSFLRGAK